MLVDDPSLTGNTTIVAENVTSLTNPYEHRIVYLTHTYGEYPPGLYMYANEKWRLIMYDAPLSNTSEVGP